MTHKSCFENCRPGDILVDYFGDHITVVSFSTIPLWFAYDFIPNGTFKDYRSVMCSNNKQYVEIDFERHITRVIKRQ